MTVGCEWRHASEAWAEIWEKSVSWVLPWKKTVDFRLLAVALCQVRTWFGADGKVRCISFPYVEKPFNSKVIKCFVPELRSRVAYIYILDTYRRNDNAGRKTQEGRHKKTSLEKYSPLLLLQGFERVVQGFACERVLETEHKLHILTPLLWPSRCVFLVLLMLGSTPSGVSEGPLGQVWLSLPHLVSNSLGVCWQLLWDPNST